MEKRIITIKSKPEEKGLQTSKSSQQESGEETELRYRGKGSNRFGDPGFPMRFRSFPESREARTPRAEFLPQSSRRVVSTQPGGDTHRFMSCSPQVGAHRA